MSRLRLPSSLAHDAPGKNHQDGTRAEMEARLALLVGQLALALAELQRSTVAVQMCAARRIAAGLAPPPARSTSDGTDHLRQEEAP